MTDVDSDQDISKEAKELNDKICESLNRDQAQLLLEFFAFNGQETIQEVKKDSFKVFRMIDKARILDLFHVTSGYRTMGVKRFLPVITKEEKDGEPYLKFSRANCISLLFVLKEIMRQYVPEGAGLYEKTSHVMDEIYDFVEKK